MKVKVWNKNDYPFTDDNFYGEKIHIPAKSYVMMEYDRAMDFKGKPSPMVVDGNNVHLPEGYKMIWVEESESVSEANRNLVLEQVCQACSKSFESQASLIKHIKNEHSEIWADKKEDVERALEKDPPPKPKAKSKTS